MGSSGLREEINFLAVGFFYAHGPAQGSIMDIKTITYLNAATLAERFGVTEATIWRWQKNNPKFPAPAKLSSNCTRWRLADIEKFESEARQC